MSDLGPVPFAAVVAAIASVVAVVVASAVAVAVAVAGLVAADVVVVVGVEVILGPDAEPALAAVVVAVASQVETAAAAVARAEHLPPTLNSAYSFEPPQPEHPSGRRTTSCAALGVERVALVAFDAELAVKVIARG